MNLLKLTLFASAAALFAFAPITSTSAQDEPAVATRHGSWTLKEREDWLRHKIDASRDNGALDRGEHDRVRHQLDDIHHDEDAMRHKQDGQLTDNQTSRLEARLDEVAARIHWANENSFERPW